MFVKNYPNSKLFSPDLDPDQGGGGGGGYLPEEEELGAGGAGRQILSLDQMEVENPGSVMEDAVVLEDGQRMPGGVEPKAGVEEGARGGKRTSQPVGSAPADGGGEGSGGGTDLAAENEALRQQIESLSRAKHLRDVLEQDPSKAREVFDILLRDAAPAPAARTILDIPDEPELPERPARPEGYDAYDAATDPDSESAKYQESLRAWELDVTRIRAAHDAKREVAEFFRQGQKAEAEKVAHAQLVVALTEEGLTSEEDQKGFMAWAASDESLSQKAWIQAYKAAKGLATPAPQRKTQADRLADQADEARRHARPIARTATPPAAPAANTPEDKDRNFAHALSGGRGSRSRLELLPS